MAVEGHDVWVRLPGRLANYCKLASIRAMDAKVSDVIKHREIGFRGPHHDPNQARTATLVLSDVRGIVQVRPQHALLIQVSYDITWINLQVIDDLLAELGFHLDNSLMMKLRRALYYYTEDAEQETLGCKRGRGNCTQAIFINRYRQLEHGCRDIRPDHWRQYL